MPAKLTVNLNYLKDNIKVIKSYINKNSELLIMVKADAYGTGIIEVSKCLVKNNIKYLGVAYFSEAKEIIENNIKANIVIFSNILNDEIKEAVKFNFILTISDIKTAKKINSEAKIQNKKVKVHLNIDTGMTRLGVRENNLDLFLKEIIKLKNIDIEGVYTHLSSADTDLEYTDMQINLFKDMLLKLNNYMIKPKYIHISNSAGVLLKLANFCNTVRVGISAYGYYPSELIAKHPVSRFVDKSGIAIYIKNKQLNKNIKQIKLKGILKLQAKICSIKEVEKGVYVSYSKSFITERKTKIAVVQIGYADGLNRLLSNKYEVIVKGKKAKIIGNICMDMCMIDITDIDNVKLSDSVTIFDYDDGKIDEIAKICNTINYEIISTIGKRIERKYIGN